ncbi:MAG: hypothetical protein ACXU9D_06300 [Xanthobacteraceae bacterium]
MRTGGEEFFGCPIVYLRQSSAAQVEHNRESTDRQYALTATARELGWPDDRIIIIDEDLGVSGSGAVVRSGFQRLGAEVALSRVGLERPKWYMKHPMSVQARSSGVL